MIKVKRVFMLVRSKNKDNDEVKFSNYDILEALNEAIRYINSSYAMKNSDFLERVKDYKANADDGTHVDLANDGVELPEDFVTMQDIRQTSSNEYMHPIAAIEDIKRTDEYKMVQNRIYAGSDFRLLYRGRILEVDYGDIDNAEATIDLPSTFFDGLVKMTGMILNEADTDIMAKATDQIMSSIVPRRRYSNVEVPMPFIV